MAFSLAVAMLAAVTSVCAAVPGIVLVLRRQSMLTDAISHAVLPGIVIAAMITQSIDSPWLLVGATIAGVIVVLGTEFLAQTGLVAGDSSTGLVFPPLFAIGVILLTANFRSSHLSEHSVLVGDLNLAAFNRLIIGHYDFGPRYAWILVFIILINVLVFGALYRPMNVLCFDPEFAKVSGIRTKIINYIIMVLMCLTVVAAFHVAGSILVVALMIVPAATATLVARTVPGLIAIALVVALLSSQLGFWLAYQFDGPTSAVMACVDGVVFLIVLAVLRIIQRRRSSHKNRA